MNLIEAFKDNWIKQRFSAPGETILLAVSGGMDSMAMAHLFLSSHLPFAVAHCNFGLRAEESDKDEEMVRRWCFHHNVPFHHTRFDTKTKMDEWGKGVQETARMLRYEWFESLRTEFKYARIATAHHANDNAETLLMHLLKGTGIAGLHGIPAKNDKVIRPLLFAPRAVIEDYVVQNQVPYREDASNATDNYLRNEVRHHIIPPIEKIFPAAIKQIGESIERFTEAEQIYRKAIDKEIRKLAEQRGNDIYIPILKLQKTDTLSTLCYELFTQYGFTPAQLPHIISLMQAESGHYITSQTHKIIRNRDFLIVTSNRTASTDIIAIDALPCKVTTEHHVFELSLLNEKPGNLETGEHIALIDAANLQFPLLLRKWKTGDYFYPLGMGMKKKKLSKYFIDSKVPLHEKERVWVLESGRRIAWVCGMRLDERFKIKDKTLQVVKISLRQGLERGVN